MPVLSIDGGGGKKLKSGQLAVVVLKVDAK